MFRLGLMAALTLVPALAFAEAPRGFVQLRDRAQPLESLSSFLSKFVGDCGSDVLARQDCLKKVDAFRKQSIGKSYYLILDDDAQQLVQPRGFSPHTHQMEFALTPFFESAGLALTQGQPGKLDAEGRPVIPLIRMVSILNDSLMPMDVDRVFRTGNVRMQIIFKPLGVWKLPKRDRHGYVEGVKAQLQGVRLSEARSGGEVATWLAK
jgi:hypothetical protein